MLDTLPTFKALDLAAAPGNYGDLITDAKGWPAPANHYLVCVRESAGVPDIRRIYDYGIADIAVSERQLFAAVQGPKGHPGYLGPGFKNMLWQFPCYITFVIDNDDWRFNWNMNSPITFVDDGASAPNHAFYNAVQVKVPVYDQTGTHVADRDAVRCMNFVTDENGDILVHPAFLRYKMDLNLLQPDGHGGYIPVYIDPDGQNQGPPNIP
jgi:hypothetical protein